MLCKRPSERSEWLQGCQSLLLVATSKSSPQEWQRLSHVPSFGRLLMAAPLTAEDLPRRNRSAPRKSNL